MLTPNHYMRAYTDAQLDAIIDDPCHYGVGERLDADSLRLERVAAEDRSCDPYRARAAELAAKDAARRVIVNAAPVDHEGRTLTLASTCGHYALDVWYDGRCNSCHQRNLSGVRP